MRNIVSCEFNMDTACVELCLEDGTLPVSYTHLDVYKRQLYPFGKRSGLGIRAHFS